MRIVDAAGVGKTYPASIGLKGLFKSKNSSRTALQGVTFFINTGEIFGFLGPNGAGKTTILKIISTLTTPDSGSVIVNGFDVKRQAASVRASIGVCAADERSFYGRLSGRENLRFFGAMQGLRRKTLENRIDIVSEKTKIADRLANRVQEYSTGMRQRLNLARALLCDPPILILDEPTKALDPVNALELRHYIREDLVAKEGKTILLATNQLDEAWSLCDRIAILSNHTISACGAPVELEQSAGDGPANALEGFLHHIRDRSA